MQANSDLAINIILPAQRGVRAREKEREGQAGRTNPSKFLSISTRVADEHWHGQCECE